MFVPYRARDEITGETRYRQTWGGKLVLQVQVSLPAWKSRYTANVGGTIPRRTEWRDATMQDLLDLERFRQRDIFSRAMNYVDGIGKKLDGDPGDPPK